MEFVQLLVVGLVTGCVYALSATGLVVTYTTSGIFNFAHGAIGMLGAFTYWQLTVGWGWPAALALPAVLLVLAPLFGAGVERVLIRPLHGASVDVTLVITLGLLLFLLGAANYIWDPATSRVLPELFTSGGTSIAGVNLSSQQILIVVVAVAVALALRTLFSRTRIGIAMRGVVDDPDLCAMSGASPARIQQLSWAIGASLASVAGILIAPKVGLSSIQLTLLVINGYAAALFGRLKSLPRTAVGGILLGIVVEMYPVYIAPHVPGFSTTATELTKAVPMIFLGVLLLFLPSARLRTSTAAGRIAPTVPGLRQSLVGGVGLVVVAVVLTESLSSDNLGIATSVVVLAIALLSLVLLTGYSGQTSLCVLTFVGLGAWAMGHSGHSVLGLLWGALLAGAAGALVALATARLRGLYLALATFAFAKGMDEAFFYFHLGAGQQLEIARFRLPGIDTSSASTFFLLCTLVLAVASVGVLAVRRGRWGRQLTALNDSPAACATLGVNTTVTKVAVFTVAAAMAGFAGGLYGSSRGIVTNNDFAVLGSLALLLAVRVGGINTITGAVFGSLTITMFPEIQKHVHGLPDKLQLAYLLTGLAAVSVGRDPDGLGGQFSRLGHHLRGLRTPPSSSPTGIPELEEARLVHS
ncbi:MAG: amino acid/amide transporter rane protein 2, family / amino acid/amide transporter [Frankiales bacterium]|jgi:branched-chain amino acid transport system permease protein|nr:amino acid/amide transporter rane protein 2, family / amino acid/amide transporter [Frankiales bacterium]